jgi:hypothetical protein
MVNHCANPKCAKPLHYLREGRIFVFNMQPDSPEGVTDRTIHRLQHYWLCGDCSQTMLLEKTSNGIRLVVKAALRRPVHQVGEALAS